MKLLSLGTNPRSPCYLLDFKHTRILLDCGLESSAMLNFLPQSLITPPAHLKRVTMRNVLERHDIRQGLKKLRVGEGRREDEDNSVVGGLCEIVGRVFIDGEIR